MSKFFLKRKFKYFKYFFCIIFCCSILLNFSSNEYIEASSDYSISNEKIEWGIKNMSNHEQPQLGSKTQELLSKYNGIALGSNDEKVIYLTFDLGYEAGYTEKILDVLKEKNISATFFITAHYLNTASNLVERMINEGHIVGNHTPNYLMSLDYKIRASSIHFFISPVAHSISVCEIAGI